MEKDGHNYTVRFDVLLTGLKKWVISLLNSSPWTKPVLHHEQQAQTEGSRQEQTGKYLKAKNMHIT